MNVTMCNTPELLIMAHNARGKVREADLNTLHEHVDPDGTHVLNMHMLHNDNEMRTWWLVKAKNSMTPTDLWLDVDLDVFEKNTRVEDRKPRASNGV